MSTSSAAAPPAAVEEKADAEEEGYMLGRFVLCALSPPPLLCTHTVCLNAITPRTPTNRNHDNNNDTRGHDAGIDEAGRGPVLGPMVYGCAWCPVKKLEEVRFCATHNNSHFDCFRALSLSARFAQLNTFADVDTQLKACDFDDSKKLTEAQREGMFAGIQASSFMGWSVDIITAASMSANMLAATPFNLNAISHDSAIGLIRACIDSG
jgi:hypothetical protein